MDEEQIVSDDYNHNEIHNAEVGDVEARFTVRRVISLVVLAALVLIVGYMLISILIGTANIDAGLNVLKSPRALFAPFLLGLIYVSLVWKSSDKAAARNVIVEIIENISDAEISIITLAEKYYKDEYNPDDKAKTKFLIKEITGFVIDLLWKGRLPGWKYVVDGKVLVRIVDKEPPSLDNV